MITANTLAPLNRHMELLDNILNVNGSDRAKVVA